MSRTAVEADREIGARIRARRDALGLNQTELGRASGVTFQQIQKYENGTNRVSASRLIEIAKALSCSPLALLPGGEEVPAVGDDASLAARAIAAYGEDAQWDMVLEEAIELSLEVTRRSRGRHDLAKIAEEAADMEIMLDQVRLMLPPGLVDAARRRKEARLAAKLDARRA